MGPQGEPETDDVRQKEEQGSKPCIRLDGFLKERVLNRCGLREVALAAISILQIDWFSTGMTIQLMLWAKSALK